jgi:hypothetical protein
MERYITLKITLGFFSCMPECSFSSLLESVVISIFLHLFHNGSILPMYCSAQIDVIRFCTYVQKLPSFHGKSAKSFKSLHIFGFPFKFETELEKVFKITMY